MHIQTVILCFKKHLKILKFSFYIFIYIVDILLYNKFIYLLTRGSPAVDPVTQQPGKSSGSVSGSGLKILLKTQYLETRKNPWKPVKPGTRYRLNQLSFTFFFSF